MNSYKYWLSKVLTGIMAVTTVLTALIPSVAHAASLYQSTVSTATVGTAITPTIKYTVDTADQTWATGDTLTITLPDNFPAWSSLTYTVEADDDTTNDGDGNETAVAAHASNNGTYSVSSRVMTVRWSTDVFPAVVDDASQIRVIVTAGMTPQYSGATSNITFDGTTAAVDTNPTGTATINVSAADAAATITLGTNSVVGATGNMTLQVTTPIDLVSGSTVVFTAPGNLDVSGVTFGSETFSGAGSFSTCTSVYQVVTCTSSGAHTAGTGTIVMSGVKSLFEASSKTVTSLSVKDASANSQATDSTGTVTDTSVGALTSANLSFQTNVGEAVGNVTIGLVATVTSTLGIPNGGSILVTFPTGYNISLLNGRIATGLSGVNGTWTAMVSGQQTLITQSGGTTSTAGSVSLTFWGVKNPKATNSTGTFTVATETAAAEAVMTGTAASVSVININFNSSQEPIAPAPVVSTPIVVVTPIPVVAPAPAPVPVVVAPAPTAPSLPSQASLRAEAVKKLLSGKFNREAALTVSETIAMDLGMTATPTALCTANSLVKVGGNSAVYYCGADGKRYVFPNSQIFKSWFGDFKDVQTISAEQMASLQLGGNVKYRPGASMVKLQTDPRVYVVAPGGVLRWVSSEALATKHYGDDWNKKVQDISDAFFANYTVGEPIAE